MATKKGKTNVPAVPPKAAPPPTEVTMLDVFYKDAGQGLENIRREDTKIPFLRVLQALSPQLQDGDPAYIAAAKPGDLWNSVTNEIFKGKDGALVVPVHFEKVYIEWKPRDQGGGFVAQYGTREEALEACAAGNDITDTAHHYCLIRNSDGMWAPVVVPCKSTMLSVSRGWNAMMQSVMFQVGGKSFTPPSFACIYNVSTARQQNDKGTWYNLSVERVANVDDAALYAMAKTFRQTLLQGGVKLHYEGLGDETAEPANTDELPSF